MTGSFSWGKILVYNILDQFYNKLFADVYLHDFYPIIVMVDWLYDALP